MPRLAGGVSLVILVGLGVCLVMYRPSGKAEPLPPQKPKEGEFAADRFPALPEPAAFNTRRAMGYLEDVCKIGPRLSGSAGMKKQQELLEKHFKGLGGQVAWQRFTARQRQREPVAMANLVVSWHPDRQDRVLLCSHYDTRPQADQDQPRNWNKPFLSANDGGSGVVLLMELAHAMKDLKTNVGVDFVFFDGEEYVFNPGDTYFFGSEHFGREYRKARGKPRYHGALLLDMVGGKDARFPVEQHSARMAPGLVQQVWGLAQRLDCRAFRADALSDVPVEDDHVALNRHGIPAVDIIDFNYPHWHRLTDVPENCSGESLGQVAKVLSVWLQWLK
jgi:glutaminyl-peptide cyclotransferase